MPNPSARQRQISNEILKIEQFIEFYYNQFDGDRNSLATLYVSYLTYALRRTSLNAGRLSFLILTFIARFPGL